MSDNDKKPQRTEIGRVTSDKMDKTATVLVERRVKHPVYGKFVTKSKKYHVHDPDNAAHLGDTVQIRQCRPMSKTKSWEYERTVSQAAD